MGAPLLCPRFWVRVKPDMVASERGPLPAYGSLPGSQVLEGSRHWTGRLQTLQRPSRTADPGSGRLLRPEGPACDHPAPPPRPGLPKAPPPVGCLMDVAGPASCRTMGSCSRQLLHTTRTREHTHGHARARAHGSRTGGCYPSARERGLQTLWRGRWPAGAQSRPYVGVVSDCSPRSAGREGQGRSSPGEGSRIPGSWRVPWATAAWVWLPPGECCHLVASWTQRLQAGEG